MSDEELINVPTEDQCPAQLVATSRNPKFCGVSYLDLRVPHGKWEVGLSPNP